MTGNAGKGIGGIFLLLRLLLFDEIGIGCFEGSGNGITLRLTDEVQR
jgi:hypothetical protein